MDNRNRGKRMLGLMVGMAAGIAPALMPNLKPRRKPVELTRSMYEKAKRSAGFRSGATGKIHGAKECARRVRQLAYGAISNYFHGCQYPNSPEYKIIMEARRMSHAVQSHSTHAPIASTKINFFGSSDAS